MTLTDEASGWTECVPLFNRDQASVIQALERVRQLLPFPLLGLDTDNGEFINAEVLAYCEREHISFTRCAIAKLFSSLSRVRDTTDADVVKAASYLAPKGGGGQQHDVKRPGRVST